MIFDDRLDTVLRTVAAGPLAGRTQFRQLIDLLRRDGALADDQRAIALARLDSLRTLLAADDRAAMVRQARLQSPDLVARFAAEGAPVALAAIMAADLPESAWVDLIPVLPVQARGFLRHRRDLGSQAQALLARLGVGDFVLTQPEGFMPCAVEEPAKASAAAVTPVAVAPLPFTPPTPPLSVVPPPSLPVQPLRTPDNDTAPDTPPAAAPAREGVGAIVRRIEAFRRLRDTRPGESAHADGPPGLGAPHDGHPRLPFADEAPAVGAARLTAIDLVCDAIGTVTAAGAGLSPMLAGLRLFSTAHDAPARCDAATARATAMHLPIVAGRVEIDGSPHVAGAWRIDAVPAFAPDGGRFAGYEARLRRPAATAVATIEAAGAVAPAPDPTPDSAGQGADRMRQLLHELRTPINAIQGFAEVIQQQVFGPAPHQYRGLAASIAADAARMLAGFEEIERLARLESGTISCEAGEADLAGMVDRLFVQLEPALGPRQVRLGFARPHEAVLVGIAPVEIERLVWRILSVIASTAAPAERLAAVLEAADGIARLSLPLTAQLALRDDDALFAPDAGRASPMAAMLGHGFALRLARAEARALGGRLDRAGARLMLTLPILTVADQTPSQSYEPASGAG